MKRYFRVDFAAMREFGLTDMEWRICENTEFLCNEKPSNFYSKNTRAELGEYFGLSEDRMKKIVQSLVERGFLNKNKKHHLRPGKLWAKVQELNGKALPKKDAEVTAHKKLNEELEETPVRAVEYMVHFEDEFGEDEVSPVKSAPSKNEVRKEATCITELRETTKELAVTMADSFWYKQEGLEWKRVSKWEPLLRRFIDNWERNDRDNKKVKYKPKEQKVTKPTTPEEMRLYLKQMGDDERAKIKFNRQDSHDSSVLVPMRINQNGFPVTVEGGDYQTDSYNAKVWNSLLERLGKK